MKLKRYLIIFFFVVCLLPAYANAVPPVPHNVYGYVTYNTTNNSVSGAVVKFKDDGTVQAEDITDSSGYYDVNVDGSSGDIFYLYVGDWNSSKYIEWTSGASEQINISRVPQAPTVNTEEAEDITTSSAVLNATVSYTNETTQVNITFQYRQEGGSWSETSPETITFSSYSKNVSGLTSNTTYEFRAKIRFNGSSSPNYGGVETFTTSAEIPDITTEPASNVDKNSATLQASISYNDFENTNVSVRFQHREVGGNWTSTGFTNTSDTAYSETIDGLSSGTKYEYRAQMLFNGTVYDGDIKSFTTNSEDTTDGGGNGGDGTTDGGNGGAPGGGIAPPEEEEEPEAKKVEATVEDRSATADIGSVSENQTVEIEFSPVKVIESVRFTSEVSADDVSLKFRYLDLNRPEGVPEPGNYVYSYEVLSLKGLRDSEIRNSRITFRTSESWIDRMDGETTNVTMKRFSDGEWFSLGTNLLNRFEDYYRFRASTPGFSYFSVIFSREAEVSALMNVKNVELDPKRGKVPLNLSVKIRVENYGLAPGEKKIGIYLDEKSLTSKIVSVEPGETKIIPFYVTVKEPGEHTIRVDDVSKSFTVKEAGMGILTVIGFIGTAVIILLGLFLIYRYGLYGKLKRISGGKEEEYDFTRERKQRRTITDIKHLNQNPRRYISEDVALKNVEVVPYTKNEEGWWHKIKDGTGEIRGLSSKKIKDEGNVEGIVEKQNGKIYIIF